MNDRAGSVGVPKQSLYALQQRKCRQSLNLQELYKKLTSRRMSLLSGRCRVCGRLLRAKYDELPDRKSTRLNSSHGYISYAVFCLKKKKTYLYHDLARIRVSHT